MCILLTSSGTAKQALFTTDKFNIISKHEYTADKWAVQQLMPADELLSAVSEGYTEAWQLADYFGVTEDFVHKAYKIYKAMSVLD